MTPDECRKILLDAMGKPLNPLQRKIGYPREKSLGGPAMARIIEIVAARDEPLEHGPLLGMSEPQMRRLESELGRVICNSGDVLFGKILIGRIDDGDNAELDIPILDIRPQLDHLPAGPL